MDLTPGHEHRRVYRGSTEVFEALKYVGLKKKNNYLKLCPVISAVGHCGFLQDPLSKETHYTWLETTSLLQGVSQCGVKHMFLEALTRNLAITQHGHTAGA